MHFTGSVSKMMKEYLVFLWSNECCKLSRNAGVKWEERICVSPDAREHDL
jgi:hypothetical protein